ncbi:MAG: hypothetical protein LIO46_00490 [Clostridiales bacterium]|nr:hypothetical protein [Clostridiales bacterium]
MTGFLVMLIIVTVLAIWCARMDTVRLEELTAQMERSGDLNAYLQVLQPRAGRSKGNNLYKLESYLAMGYLFAGNIPMARQMFESMRFIRIRMPEAQKAFWYHYDMGLCDLFAGSPDAAYAHSVQMQQISAAVRQEPVRIQMQATLQQFCAEIAVMQGRGESARVVFETTAACTPPDFLFRRMCQQFWLAHIRWQTGAVEEARGMFRQVADTIPGTWYGWQAGGLLQQMDQPGK